MFVFTMPDVINQYNFPLESGDVVKTRTTDEEIPEDLRGVKGKVVGIMTMVTVEFPDGRTETFNRNQLKIRERNTPMKFGDVKSNPKEPWKS